MIHAVTAGMVSSSGGASDPWDDLFNAASTTTPITLLYADASFITVAGAGVSAWLDAWAGGAAAHNAAQATDADRPNWDGTYVNFDVANTEDMDWDFSTQEPSGDRTHLAIIKTGTLAGNPWLFSANNGGHLFTPFAAGMGLRTFDGAFKAYASVLSDNTKYYLIWEHVAGVATSSVRVDGAQIGAKQDGINMTIANIANIGSSGGANHFDGGVVAYAIYNGVGDTAAIETVAASIVAGLP